MPCKQEPAMPLPVVNATAHSESRRDGEQGKSREWSELLHKVETSSAQPANRNGNSVIFSMLQGTSEPSSAPEAMRSADPQPLLSRQAAQQVEHGRFPLLKARRRLDRNLILRNWEPCRSRSLPATAEVSARIRSEKTENRGNGHASTGHDPHQS